MSENNFKKDFAEPSSTILNSFNEPELRTLAKKLGINLTEGATPESILRAINKLSLSTEINKFNELITETIKEHKIWERK
jgi:hypothetical protein